MNLTMKDGCLFVITEAVPHGIIGAPYIIFYFIKNKHIKLKGNHQFYFIFILSRSHGRSYDRDALSHSFQAGTSLVRYVPLKCTGCVH